MRAKALNDIKIAVYTAVKGWIGNGLEAPDRGFHTTRGSLLHPGRIEAQLIKSMLLHEDYGLQFNAKGDDYQISLSSVFITAVGSAAGYHQAGMYDLIGVHKPQTNSFHDPESTTS